MAYWFAGTVWPPTLLGRSIKLSASRFLGQPLRQVLRDGAYD